MYYFILGSPEVLALILLNKRLRRGGRMGDHYIRNKDLSGKRILVVDDNEILLRAWSRILSREHCEFYCTSDPEEALQILETENMDILITDIVMPKMDGFSLVKKAREKQEKLQIILTTGYVCDFSNVSLETPAHDIHLLLKPYHNINDVQNFLGRLLRGDVSINEQNFVESKDHRKVHLWQL